MSANPDYRRGWVVTWVIAYVAVLAWSGYAPKDRFTWWLEVAPALIGVVALAVLYRRFRFTPLAAWLILAHCAILMVGGRYTYAEVPLFDWLRDTLGQARNNYDKVGHVMQGLVPTILAREVLIRRRAVNGKGWLAFVCVSFALALSAVYELIEWLTAVLKGEAAEAFLGTQGDVWDTQTDMACALAGSILALLALSWWHDRQLSRLRD